MKEIINNICGIYSITNIISKKIYIGQSANIKSRWVKHKTALRENTHANKHLQSSWNKYGESAFVFNIIEECEVNMLNERETYWIKYYDSVNKGYNLNYGGDGIRGYKHTPEEIEKMRQIQNPLAVLQFDLNFNLIAEWAGVSHANKILKCSRKPILDRCEHNIIGNNASIEYKGSYWVYKDEYNSPTFSWDKYLRYESDFIVPKKEKEEPIKIYQYDLDRNLIKIWKSLDDIDKKFNKYSIKKVCLHKGKKSHKGYIWTYEGYDFSDGYFDIMNTGWTRNKTVAVAQYDVNGNYIQTFNSIADAARAVSDNNAAKSNITQAVKKNKKMYGYIWKKIA